MPPLDPRQLHRFHNEALAATSLHHKHIIPVYAVACERGVYFYAMQFIEAGRRAADLLNSFDCQLSIARAEYRVVAGRNYDGNLTGEHTPAAPCARLQISIASSTKGRLLACQPSASARPSNNFSSGPPGSCLAESCRLLQRMSPSALPVQPRSASFDHLPPREKTASTKRIIFAMLGARPQTIRMNRQDHNATRQT